MRVRPPPRAPALRLCRQDDLCRGRRIVRSSNPVLSRLGQAATSQRPADGYGIYPSGPVAPGRADRMTLDDVVVRTVGLLALTAVAGALSWLLLPEGPTAW